ncbi:FAD-linked oxidase [Agromyces sp. Root1464]|uniref:FAD-binding oxidoreductase n=1 Tax=Agromyces sp. Root1464 TaxID=1736467 RepID=UPI0006FDBCA6|nr:FAD-binding oxidoreductase [Agromyces sp. Root1464]KQZ08232.1 FAD-linked oxidase [Agromyces sp. Root1464]
MAHATLHDIAGNVLEPGDDGYDEARTVWNGMIDRHPRYVVCCTDATDVAAAVRFATRNDLEIGVRCGGHGIVGHAVPDGGLMIDLRPMGDVQVDAVGRRARVQGGALLGALDRASQEYGLATTAGNVSHTGVGGLALGGGMGWLARRLGLACDNVVAFELVTADGESLRVDHDSHRELDWALRGGGGNFGVVTAFEFALHPVPGDAIAVEFHFSLDGGSTTAAMRAWRDLSIDAPREATFTATISGRTLALGFVWVGDAVDARRHIDSLETRLRQAAEPIANSVDPLSYLQLQTREDDVEGHAWRRYWKGHYFRELADDLIDALLDRDDDLAPDVSLQAYGGAIADVPGDATAFSRRDTAFEFVAASRWRLPDEDAPRMAAARRYASGMDGYASGAYVNVLGDDGDAGLRRAYPAEQLARLTAVKDAYDPGNVFHLNQNIRPTDGRAGHA